MTQTREALTVASPECPFDVATETLEALAWHGGYRAGIKFAEAAFDRVFARAESPAK